MKCARCADMKRQRDELQVGFNEAVRLLNWVLSDLEDIEAAGGVALACVASADQRVPPPAARNAKREPSRTLAWPGFL